MVFKFFHQKQTNDIVSIQYRRSTKILNVQNCELICEGQKALIYKVLFGKFRKCVIKKYVCQPFKSAKSHLKNEIYIYNRIEECKVFIRFHKAVINRSECLLTMELMSLGDISEHAFQANKLSLDQIRLICIQLIKALRFLESKNILLRNLSFENILKRHHSACNFSVKITNFSYAVDLERNRRPTDRVGDVIYQSPEAIVGLQQSQTADIWAFGIITFILCTCQHPFISDFAVTKSEIEELIFKARITEESGYNDVTDPSIVDLINSCLVKSPLLRSRAHNLFA